ncbi:MAG: hypothetical protein KGL39_52300 [Patescibacteria group bacterium]|nr:hypothetical protein [Patescibacteria group bacterium]
MRVTKISPLQHEFLAATARGAEDAIRYVLPQFGKGPAFWMVLGAGIELRERSGRTLEQKGLIEDMGIGRFGQRRFRITDAGRAAISKAQGATP